MTEEHDDGAVDLDACRNRSAWGNCRCAPVCAVCGYPKHTGIHGPVFGQPPGSKPYGHVFAPKRLAEDHQP
jgi:hypothetical protein